MAGIGFKLNHYFGKRDLVKSAIGSLYSIFIATGPWLITILSLACISILVRGKISDADFNLFKSLITYCFAFSLISFGFIEMPLTRFLADKLYLKNTDNFVTTFLFLVGAITISTISIGSFILYWIDISLPLKIYSLFLFNGVMVTWLVMVFLSASKKYRIISLTFLFGSVVSVLSCVVLGARMGVEGYLLGFTLGHILIAFVLSCVFYFEFDQTELNYIDLDYYFKRHRNLVFVGFIYYLGVWVDKFVFWWGGHGEQIVGFIYNRPIYDSAMFISYLTVVPSFAVFLVGVETRFYVRYRNYFQSIDAKKNLFFLEEAIKDMIRSLRNTGLWLIKIQCFCTLIAWYFSDDIIRLIGLPSVVIPIFKYGVLGAFFHVLFLFINIVLLYFENEKEVLINYTVFFVTNFLFSFLTHSGDIKYQGLGYVLACFLTLMISYIQLNRKLFETNYSVFMKQGITGVGQYY
jgi:uncharacterized membrane protein